ncbi:MAG: type I-U CRISPR-associated protein Cas7 [Acidobacteriia bacterium]|nr:type I-U CRISPR-associated protein Cas7 [Terriglobia bacterium]
MTMSSPTSLTPAALLADVNRHRITLQATLAPLIGDRFQPAGFPEIGHVIYRAPRQDRTTEDVCIMDSAASMANHLEAVCHANPLTLELHNDIATLPHVQCWTGDGNLKEPKRLVVTSLSEGHRLASSHFVDEKAKLVVDGKASDESFIGRLLGAFGLQDLGTKTHPLPGDWGQVFNTIFRYDPNSLVHGILFPSLGIKIPRVLTAHHEAFGAARVPSSGVKFDKLGKTTSGQPIFAVDEETAREIRATFVLDLSLVRSFGRDDKVGLKERQKTFLLELAFWKIKQLLSAPFRFRSNCDLRLDVLSWIGGDISDPKGPKDKGVELSELSTDIKKGIAKAFDEENEGVTKVYWPCEELFRPGRDTEENVPEDTGGDAAGSDDPEAS